MKGILEKIKGLELSQIIFLIAAIFIAVFFVVSLILRHSSTIHETNPNSSQTNDVNVEKLKLSDTESVYYSEGDEDGSFNYILNGRELIEDNNDMPYYYYTEMPDALNTYLKSNGYFARQLTFIEGKRKSTKYTVTFTISECSDTISVTNNIGQEDYTFLIQANIVQK